MRKIIFALAACAALAGLLTGCGRTAGNAVSDAASDAGSAISGAMSRIESDLDDMRPGSSGLGSRRPDDDRDYAGSADPGRDGFIGSSAPASSARSRSSGSSSSRKG